MRRAATGGSALTRWRVGRVDGLFAICAVAVLCLHALFAWLLPALPHPRGQVWASAAFLTAALLLRLRRVAPVACALLFAGALGNVGAWLVLGHVPDYAMLVVGDQWIVFNLADVAIATGIVLMLIATVRNVRAKRAAR